MWGSSSRCSASYTSPTGLVSTSKARLTFSKDPRQLQCMFQRSCALAAAVLLPLQLIGQSLTPPLQEWIDRPFADLIDLPGNAYTSAEIKSFKSSLERARDLQIEMRRKECEHFKKELGLA